MPGDQGRLASSAASASPALLLHHHHHHRCLAVPPRDVTADCSDVQLAGR